MSQNFEGPEKNLMICFERSHLTSSLRKINRKDWDKILMEANCSILSTFSSKETDSYVLSESSLFVKQESLLIKTCGTTSLLSSLEPILAISGTIGLTLKTLFYFRTNFEFPEEQHFPHKNFSQEVEYISNIVTREGLVMHDMQLGESSEDSIYCVVASNLTECTEFNNRLYILNYGLPPEVCNLYFDNALVDEDYRKRHVDQQLELGSREIGRDDFLFHPCGYSMNTLYENGLATIHVTPEESCSFASFETDVSISDMQLTKVIKQVYNLYKADKCKVISVHREVKHSGSEDALAEFGKVHRGNVTTPGLKLCIESVTLHKER